MASSQSRMRVEAGGVVQGVGFRPFVYRLASRYGLSGFVRNQGAGVEIELQGERAALDRLLAELRRRPPAAARLASLRLEEIPPRAEEGFAILTSGEGETARPGISPDLGICDECLRELFDPADRRYLYPFINCTHCGPRYTIVARLPYDRSHTSMAGFTMCAACRAEYQDPADRRFHAQPIACPACGPRLWLAERAGLPLAEGREALAGAATLLQQGGIVAVKGLGGFHLAANAADQAAVARLRQRKAREEKPLAVMVAALATAERLCGLDDRERRLLVSPSRPIVLARQRPGHGLAQAVAPGNDRFGVMLAYTPLHHLLLAKGPAVLVMTSANLSEEPICIDNHEAIQRLAGIADAFLLHDRDILIRNDDSVVMVAAAQPRLVRRARGYAPAPLRLRETGPSVLGVGAELKSTVCYLVADQAVMSQHLGDLKVLAAYDFFEETVSRLGRLHQVRPELVAHDLHPDYLSSRWAAGRGLMRFPVQHHHAHLVACLAENLAVGPAIGIILDGAGLGADGTIWGGEVLIGDCAGFERYASLAPMPLPGGDLAVREPWRAAVAYLLVAFDGRLPDLPFLADPDLPLETLVAMVAKKINCPVTSSCGRLFDAVAAMAGGRRRIHYEGQAAIELMQAAGGLEGPVFACDWQEERGMIRLMVPELVQEVVGAVRQGQGLATIGRRFHLTLVRCFADLAGRAAQETGIRLVVLSGGVFQNRVLFEGLARELERQGLTVLSHRLLPCNDGAVSLGQAVAGRHWLRREAGG